MKRSIPFFISFPLIILFSLGVVVLAFIIPFESSQVSSVTYAQTPSVPAFPGAEGFGANSIGGRGGRVIEVTNLNDNGSGSLRSCVEASGPRTCVFRVGGTISLDGLTIINPYITIAGQTAPGGGITLKYGKQIQIATHDVVIRYVRFRSTGDQSFTQDAIEIGGGVGARRTTSSWTTFL